MVDRQGAFHIIDNVVGAAERAAGGARGRDLIRTHAGHRRRATTAERDATDRLAVLQARDRVTGERHVLTVGLGRVVRRDLQCRLVDRQGAWLVIDNVVGAAERAAGGVRGRDRIRTHAGHRRRATTAERDSTDRLVVLQGRARVSERRVLTVGLGHAVRRDRQRRLGHLLAHRLP